MKRALWLFVAVACGGASSTTHTTPAATARAPSATETASAVTAEDTSPQPIGTRHKKVGSGWFLSGNGKEFYDAIYEPGAEPVIVVKQTSDAHGRWVTLMKNVSAAPYVGKRVRIRVGVKSAGVVHGEAWARAAGPHAPEDTPGEKTPLVATSAMKTYELVVEVKDGMRVVEYGVSLAGEGEVWVGKDAIDVI